MDERLSQFKSFYSGLVGKDETAYQGSIYFPSSVIRPPLTKDTLEQIRSTIETGSTQSRIELSKKYFLKNGFYKRIILHYATLYKYTGVLIPNINQNLSLSKKIKNKYYKALDFVESVNLPDFCYQVVLTALVEGSFYGAISKIDDKIFSYIQLPSKYCKSLFKDEHGREVIQFNVQYFDQISDETKKQYVVYTDNSVDENGNVRVFASIYKTNDKGGELLPIKTNKEWKVIETILDTIQSESNKSGE